MGIPLKGRRVFCIALLLCGEVRAGEMAPLEEDFLLFLGEWADEQGDVLVPEESDLWLGKSQSEVRWQRELGEDGEVREE